MANIHSVRIIVIDQKGQCEAGHKIGDQWIINESLKTPEGLCCFAFCALYPSAEILQFGGCFPWQEIKGIPDKTTAACPDPDNPVIFEIQRLHQKSCKEK
jgi:uncharacterized repeat protein (TIGR04076 family)